MYYVYVDNAVGWEFDERAGLVFDPSTDFGDRFGAVIDDLLNGRHVSQNADVPKKKPAEDEENPTEDY